MKFDEMVNSILIEAAKTPHKDDLSIGGNLKFKQKHHWKDPLNRHSMKDARPIDRKKPGWVPRTHQREIALPMAERLLNIAKRSKQGIWKISKAQAVALATKYRMHLPNDRTPAKRLGSTGIVMWRKTRGVPVPVIYLVKHEKLIRGGLKSRKKQAKFKSGKPLGREVFKGSFKSMYKAKKPKKPLGPTFEPGKVGT